MIASLSLASYVDRLGWVLVHSLWQYALLMLVGFVLQRALQRCTAVTRYWALLATMGSTIIAPVATWCWLPAEPPAAAPPIVASRIDAVAIEFAPAGADQEARKTPPPIVEPYNELESPRMKVEPPSMARTAEDPWLEVGWVRARDMLRPWLSAIVWAWCFGVLAFATRPLVGWYTVRRLRAVGVLPVPATVQGVLERVSRRLGLRRATQILQSTLVQVPVVAGYFRPVILVPMSVISGLPASQLEAILAHELAHIRRHDFLVNLLQTLLETVFFYHPAVWWLSRQIRNERENCCDDLAVAVVGSGMDYGRALLAVAELQRPSTALVLGVRDGSLLGRVRRIVGGEPSHHVLGGGMLVGIGLIVAAMLVVLFALAVIPLSLLGSQGGDSDEDVAAQNAALRDVASQPNELTPSLPTEQTTKPQKDADATLIRGTVVDQQGQPIAGARLWYAYAFDESSGKCLEVDARSDAAGRFTLERPPASTEKEVVRESFSDVWAYSPDHCLGSASPRSTQAKEDTAGIRLELATATDTSLVVLDSNGQPTAGVLVEPVNYSTGRAFDLVPDGAKPFVAARTDAEGRVRLPALARDRLFLVQVTTDAYGVQTQQFTVKASEPAERTIHLRPVCRIEGRVMAKEPEWALGTRLILTTEKAWGPTEKQRPPFPTEGRADVTTDKEGRFVVPIIAEGRLGMIEMILDDKLPVRPELPRFVDLSAGTTTVLELPMRRLVDIRGSILAQDTGQPLPGIEIHVYYGEFRQGTDVVSDAKGQFSARVLPGEVSFQPQTLAKTKYLQLGSPKSYHVPEDADGFELPAIEVVPSVPVGGQLVDQNDLPVADSEVIAYFDNYLCSAAKTDKGGRFTLPKMPVSIDLGEVTYRVALSIGETRFMHDGGVEIIGVNPLVLRVKR